MKLENTLIKKTKIISTMGPTFETEEMIRDMFARGVNVVRLNTSHGDYIEHEQRIINVKKIRKELDLPISILLDTKGPEIRVHTIENKKMIVKKNDVLTIKYKEEIVGKDNTFSVTYEDLGTTVKDDQLIMVDDGKLTLKVKSVNLEKGEVTAVALNNHYIGTKKAINVPGADLTLPFIAEHDQGFIKWGIKQGIDYVAASFVRDGNDVDELRKLLDENGGEEVLIMSKIEALKAIENLNEIISKSDAIMLARGDLGVEIPYYEVPFYEKLIIDKCRAWGKPIVIATQMLDSMMENPRPTRAEVTDIYYAAMSGADATMLSGESASGNFPREAVEIMSKVNLEAENNFNYLRAFESAYAFVESSNAESAYLVAKKALTSDSKYIIAFSEKGRLINALSRFRPNALIIALIKDEKIINKFGAHYGVYAQHHDKQENINDDKEIIAIAKKLGLKSGVKFIVANKNEFRSLRIK
ncbi:MAG: pyruvate kinase [Candidatus Tyloplasma litorale]|nr:MAG: pyruvate kinase [Mycoplasmatales bacterium]